MTLLRVRARGVEARLFTLDPRREIPAFRSVPRVFYAPFVFRSARGRDKSDENTAVLSVSGELET